MEHARESLWLDDDMSSRLRDTWVWVIGLLIVVFLSISVLYRVIVVSLSGLVGDAPKMAIYDGGGATLATLLIDPLRKSGADLTYAVVTAQVGVAALAIGVLQLYPSRTVDRSSDQWIDQVCSTYMKESIVGTANMLLVLVSALLVCIVGMQAIALNETPVVLMFVVVLFMYLVTAALLTLKGRDDATTIIGRMNKLSREVRMAYYYPDLTISGQRWASVPKLWYRDLWRLLRSWLTVDVLASAGLFCLAIAYLVPRGPGRMSWVLSSCLLISVAFAIVAAYNWWVRERVLAVHFGSVGAVFYLFASSAMLRLVEYCISRELLRDLVAIAVLFTFLLFVAFVVWLSVSRRAWRFLRLERVFLPSCVNSLRDATNARRRARSDEWEAMVGHVMERECVRQRVDAPDGMKTWDGGRFLMRVLEEVGVITKRSELVSDSSTVASPSPSNPSPRPVAEIIAEFYVGPIRLPLKMRCRG